MGINSKSTPAEIRAATRAGDFTGQTSGMAYGFVQANLVVLPAAMAEDFRKYCELNPAPCPLLAVSRVGDPGLPELGRDIDIRTDISAYRVFRNGEGAEDVASIDDIWNDDMVAFALGCSFSFEEALMEAGLPVRHVELGRNVPMYVSNIDTKPSGKFSGKMVVSMRPFLPADAEKAREITSRFPRVHGAPVHIGNGSEIGIGDINKPDFGDAPQMRPGEIPVFWACGVTPQVAITNARPEISITHKPGHMLVTDRLNSEFSD